VASARRRDTLVITTSEDVQLAEPEVPQMNRPMATVLLNASRSFLPESVLLSNAVALTPGSLRVAFTTLIDLVAGTGVGVVVGDAVGVGVGVGVGVAEP